jgi:hypothetical protein
MLPKNKTEWTNRAFARIEGKGILWAD